MTAKRLVLSMIVMVMLALAAPPAHAARPATINNDDSCDIGTYPAATLLLPYFEVDFNAPQTTARTTLFTITNTSRIPQIAHVMLWTDWGYPALSFNLFLTGYDVQAINIYDIIGRGLIAGNSFTASQPGSRTTPGELSAPNGANPGFAPTAVSDCADLVGWIPANLLADVRLVLTTGATTSCPSRERVGSVHPNAIGYATIDVVATCSTTLPTDEKYFTKELLFDNVLTGDYMIIDPNAATGNYASGNPLVHIRAVPEGGAAGVLQATNLPYTFYDRYTPRQSQTLDRRQPLPSTFHARYIQGGTGAFNTNLTIWREGKTGAGALCAEYTRNRDLVVAGEIVRFDEHENFQTYGGGLTIGFPLPPMAIPAASSTPTSSSVFPPMVTTYGDVGGWLYMNLSNEGSPLYSVAAGHDYTKYAQRTGPRQSQNWVTVRMSAEGRYAVEYDATSLGNGCSPAPSRSDANYGPGTIGPLPEVNP